MDKKNILITGSTDGIGKLTAIKLAKDGHTIYIHGRSQEKVSKTLSQIKDISKNDNIKGFVSDFSDLNSVKKMSEKIKIEIEKIDILINNAGVYKSTEGCNKDGLDTRLVVNYLASYLLTNELIDLFKKSEDARIINLSSAAQSEVSNEVLLGKKNVSQGEAYAQSKLALTMWSFFMANKIENIAIIPVNPGSLLDTKMAKEAFGRVWSKAEKGVDVLYKLTTSKEFKGITGEYFDNDIGDFGQAHPDAYNSEKIERLIALTNKLLDLD